MGAPHLGVGCGAPLHRKVDCLITRLSNMLLLVEKRFALTAPTVFYAKYRCGMCSGQDLIHDIYKYRNILYVCMYIYITSGRYAIGNSHS